MDEYLNEKEQAVSRLKESVLAADINVDNLSKEVADLKYRIRDLEQAHATELVKLKAGNNS